MNINQRMKEWSQTVYGIAHSLRIARSVKLGNLTTLHESLVDASGWNLSNLGFTSNIPTREFREGDIRLDGRDHEEVFVTLSANIVRMLFINLAVLADEVLEHLIAASGSTPPNYLTSKAEWVKAKVAPKYAWAANGLLELSAIRNAFVHGNATLNGTVLGILRKAEVTDALEGHIISLSFGDLFRYRRALRTVVGELRRLHRGVA